MPRRRRSNRPERADSPRLRISGGTWRGRRLECRDAPGLRPTLAQNRERLFNWLQGRVAGAAVLDAFAGSGILGFEALSRGADRCTWVELSASNAGLIRNLMAQLDVRAGTGELIVRDFRDVLTGLSGPYDLVLLDPPFSEIRPESCLAGLVHQDVLRADSRVYLEMPADREPDLADLNALGFEILKNVTHGRIRQCLLRWARVESPPASR